jgi:hypothetical protein
VIIMTAKSGKLVKAVEPTNPEEAFEADVADPGKVAKVKAKQMKEQVGKYGSTAVRAHKANSGQPKDENEQLTTWIEIELLDEDDNPVSGKKYEIKLPDGAVAKGTLDGYGFARVEGINPGECKVCFPELDKDAWSEL